MAWWSDYFLYLVYQTEDMLGKNHLKNLYTHINIQYSIKLNMCPCLAYHLYSGGMFSFTCHTDAMEPSNLVQAGSIILAWAGHALINVKFAASPHVALRTLTLERAFGVQTLSSMLTWVWTYKKRTEMLSTNTSSNINSPGCWLWY